MQTEQCYGVVTVYRAEEDLFLILQNKDETGSWTFPKGHHEGTETPIQTAMRELKEETQITEIALLDLPLFHEEYKIAHTGHIDESLKIVEYFVGIVKDKNIVIQQNEVYTYVWATYEEAVNISGLYQGRKEILKRVKEYLDSHAINK